MPSYEQFSCPGCDYDSGRMLLLGNWHHCDACPRCREIVLACKNPFRALDLDYECPRCWRVLGCERPPAERLERCPRCHTALVHERGHSFYEALPLPQPGQKVHVLRLGQSGGQTWAWMNGSMVTLTGSAPNAPGLWWAEGRISELKTPHRRTGSLVGQSDVSNLQALMAQLATIAAVEFDHWLREDDCNLVDRLVLLSPEQRKPWMAVDFRRLRRLLETDPKRFYPLLRTWHSGASDLEHLDVRRAERELRQAEIGAIFSMLLASPPEAHCLTEVHDEEQWRRFDSVDLTLFGCSGRALAIRGGVPDTSNDARDLKCYSCPGRVEIACDGLIVGRWSTGGAEPLEPCEGTPEDSLPERVELLRGAAGESRSPSATARRELSEPLLADLKALLRSLGRDGH